MQYLTLEKESGAIQAVNMGLIGEEVSVKIGSQHIKAKLLVIVTDSDERGSSKFLLENKDLGEFFSESIRIPKPTIEDLRVGDIVLMDRGDPFENDYPWKYSVYIQDKTDYFDLCTMYKSGEVRNLKLITRKSEGVDVLDLD